jgi:hypothetical protein
MDAGVGAASGDAATLRLQASNVRRLDELAAQMQQTPKGRPPKPAAGKRVRDTPGSDDENDAPTPRPTPRVRVCRR